MARPPGIARKKLTAVLGLTLLALLGVGAFGATGRHAPSASIESADTAPSAEAIGGHGGPSARAALELGWKVGDRVGEWAVDSVHAPKPRDGVLAVRFAHGDASVTVYIANKGSTQFRPPQTTKKHDLFVSSNAPEGSSIEGQDLDTLLDAVADRVAKAER